MVPSQHQRFRDIFDVHHVAIQTYCLRRLPPEEARDTTAEVFLVAWRRLNDLPPEPKTLPYLYGIARNTVANTKRSSTRRLRLLAKTTATLPVATSSHEDRVVNQDTARRILDTLGDMKPLDQEILRLKGWESLSNPDIADVLGLSIRAVETRLSRARKELHRRATAMDPTEEQWAVPRSFKKGGAR